MRYCNFKRTQQSGFTLVELAIVMVIIGLLIGGIIKGTELVHTAQVKRVKTDVEAFRASFYGFKDKYRVFAGDMPNADARLPGCVAPNCFNGDGNNIIGIPNTNANTDQTGTAAPNVETTMFWKHLVLAGFISGISSDADPASPETGVTHPVSTLGGAYSIYHRGGVHGVSIKACPQSDVCGNNIVDARDAMELDIFWDGTPNPHEGDVIANGGGCLYGSEIYNPDGDACYVLFEISTY